jgi:hypothetical protein
MRVPFEVEREPVGGRARRHHRRSLAERPVVANGVRRDGVGTALGDDERPSVGREPDLGRIGVGGRQGHLSAHGGCQAHVAQTERRDGGLASVHHEHRAGALGNAAWRVSARGDGSHELEPRPVDPERGDLAASGVRDKEEAAVTGEHDRPLRGQVRRHRAASARLVGRRLGEAAVGIASEREHAVAILVRLDEDRARGGHLLVHLGPPDPLLTPLGIRLAAHRYSWMSNSFRSAELPRSA